MSKMISKLMLIGLIITVVASGAVAAKISKWDVHVIGLWKVSSSAKSVTAYITLKQDGVIWPITKAEKITCNRGKATLICNFWDVPLRAGKQFQIELLCPALGINNPYIKRATVPENKKDITVDFS
jgi:hypothetical protein